MSEMPNCPRGCPSVKVVRDGVQRTEGRERQRYRCIVADGSFHRFVGESGLSRTRGDGHSCVECARPLEVDGGPVALWHSRYFVKEVATALWSLAGGVSYTEAASRLRRRAWGDDGAAQLAETTVASGQMVADWLSKFGPIVAGPHAETEWPETVVLDSTRFMYTDRFTGTSNQLFCVLAAWGYPKGARKGRLWLLRAYPLQDAPTWEQFLAELPGRPELVVIDRDYGAIGGVQARWGRGRKGVPIHLCEHHLYERGKAALVSPEGWEEFHRLAVAAGGPAAAWAKHWNTRMRVQTQRRATIPEHYANGAVEAPLEEVKRILGKRRWTFRNADRMNLLLELVRIRYNRAATEADFAAELRKKLADGTALKGLRHDPRLPGRRVSISSLRAWMPQQPARHQRRFPAKKSATAASSQ
jgi:hypothetical protein